MAVVLYPDGYSMAMVTLEGMIAKHGPRMHPEFRRRFFAFIESMGGALGVGGGHRTTQPVKPGAAPEGKSFHQDQWFASGAFAYSAVDLVTTDGPDANNSHDGVTWEMTATAPLYGLHTFIKSPVAEPWHIQCIEMRGWQTWVDAGRPDPLYFKLPGELPPKPAPEPELPEQGDDPLMYIVKPGAEIAHLTAVHFACFESGIVRHASGPDTRGVVDVRDCHGAEHFNQLARAANFMAGAEITLLPE